MSSVIRPAGRLPSRVYWVRRLLLLAVVLLAVGLVWWTLGRAFGGPSGSAGDAGAQSPSAGSGPGAGAGPGGAGDDHGSGDDGSSSSAHGRKDHDKHDGSGKGENGDKKRKNHEPAVAEPSGSCSPEQVGLQVVVDDAQTGHDVPVQLRFTSLASPACTLALTPDTLMLRITADDQVIWSSDDCPDELLAKELTVRTRPATTYTFDWNGGASSGGCASGSVVEAGGYQAEAALIGGTTRTAAFMVE